MNRIETLRSQGQSIWLDYIERGMIAGGELAELVAAGIAGVTSNPAIFQSAIEGSRAYDDDLATLSRAGRDTKTIFEALAVQDIQDAADILRIAYDSANGADGFVSLEVAPDLAYDTEATVAEARRLHGMVDRPNLMIKVPATKEGIPAIRTLIGDGININVTLIFGLERYAAVKEAYIAGLEDRIARGKPVDQINSVASFFVSRVDANVDEQLERLATDDPPHAERYQSLQGEIAVANAKLAYAQFQEVFAGPRWEALAARGARVQRPLWASTSTKNPSYSDLLYVETLIGPHTVNTMPPKTLDAFRDHGTVARTIDRDLDEATSKIAALTATGLSLEAITDQLEAEGVQKFEDAFVALLATIRARQAEVAAAD